VIFAPDNFPFTTPNDIQNPVEIGTVKYLFQLFVILVVIKKCTFNTITIQNTKAILFLLWQFLVFAPKQSFHVFYSDKSYDLTYSNSNYACVLFFWQIDTK